MKDRDPIKESKTTAQVIPSAVEGSLSTSRNIIIALH